MDHRSYKNGNVYPSPQKDEMIVDIANRCRRIETRLASFLEGLGELNKTTPVWVEPQGAAGGYVRIQHPATPLASCMKVIPPTVSGDVEVWHGDRLAAIVIVD